MPKPLESAPLGGTRQLRRWHRARVLQAIRAEGGISRLKLARKLGLSPSAVTEVVAELLDEGLLTERPLPPTGQGRPSVALEVEGKRHLVLAWEIDADLMAIALLNLKGEMRAKVVLPPAPPGWKRLWPSCNTAPPLGCRGYGCSRRALQCRGCSSRPRAT